MDKIKKVGRSRPKKSTKKLEKTKKFGKYTSKTIRRVSAGNINKKKGAKKSK